MFSDAYVYVSKLILISYCKTSRMKSPHRNHDPHHSCPIHVIHCLYAMSLYNRNNHVSPYYRVVCFVMCVMYVCACVWLKYIFGDKVSKGVMQLIVGAQRHKKCIRSDKLPQQGKSLRYMGSGILIGTCIERCPKPIGWTNVNNPDF